MQSKQMQAQIIFSLQNLNDLLNLLKQIIRKRFQYSYTVMKIADCNLPKTNLSMNFKQLCIKRVVAQTHNRVGGPAC